MSKANDTQVGGEHYKAQIQHWDFAASHEFDYFQGQITKYVTRWKKKNGIQDLRKGFHFYQKYLELEEAKAAQKFPLPCKDKWVRSNRNDHPFGWHSEEELGKHPVELQAEEK